MPFPSFLGICLLCLLPILLQAQNSRNITLNSALTAIDKSNSSWISPSGDFAFGFQQLAASGGFLVAIWYNNIPEKTVIWYANGGELAQQGSKLQLTKDGIVLSYPNGTQSWTQQGSGVSHGALLDSGNLVLVNETAIFWQTFDNPTDTILPTQILKRNTNLVARYSDTNFSKGRFMFSLAPDGDLVSHTMNWPQNSALYFRYLSTGTMNNVGFQLVFNESGKVYVTAENGTIVASVLSEIMDPAQYIYQRAIIEYDGVFRRYVYPRSSSSSGARSWTMAKDFQPQDICKIMNVHDGGGACGFNSICKIGDDQRPKCSCPPHYSFLDDMDHMRGCKRDFVAPSCSSGPLQDDHFNLTEMVSTNFWGSDSDHYLEMSDTDCRDSCLSDCYCAAVVYDDGHCWKKRFPLSNGWVGPSIPGSTFIKVGAVSSTTFPEPDLQIGGGKNRDKTVLVESIFLGSSVFCNLLLLTLSVLLADNLRRKKRVKIQVPQDIAGTNMRAFSYKELQEATNGFREVIGQGAFATVYKGSIDSEQVRFVAVKKLNEPAKESQREFESEVKAIARTCHRNLVQLIGFCNEEQHRLLVYEYMPYGSIADILLKGERVSWLRRIKFAFETARGLNYLHEECNTQIIHCDIKPQNVLLDESYTARISDFGLAKLMKKEQTHTLTGIRGTRGYVAPEWFRSMPITAKVDVYSYGILLLEIICCRRCFVAEMEEERKKVLADWAFDCCEEGRFDELVEGDEEAMEDLEKVRKYVMIALCCIQEDPSHRPSMNEVLLMIKGEIESVPRNLDLFLSFYNKGL